ncbi:Cof-type HAD-IIB family hydrolase [Mesonia aestuariivivens]|uniref:Cof-type HAD-IIB family hydrolase n=1 Tax=Mesonia aestuariivivens TaxID=2796128 RepID=A0ABS6VZ05_9FLAO|nr:Cof-type HAD-IIB family hydrolase [Mesonia aestuariivivens]MBW2960817.1 Cof-type HAD-IIB family hydrolase [Mesonia aestuariivivens]
MSYKIVFSDIDGTLLNKERELSERTIKTIKAIKDDIPVVLISARMPKAMRHLQQQLGIENQPIICYNGGFLLVDEKPVSSTAIPVNTIQELAKFNETNQVHLSLYNADEWHVPAHDYWAKREERNTKVTPSIKHIHDVMDDWGKRDLGAHKIMCMGEENKIENMYQFLKDNYSNQLHVYRSKNTYIEIADKQISKLTAIKYLLKNHYNLSIEETVAFGDNYNDVEMINGVGLGIAVANAREESKAVANKITDASIDDGVAKSLEELFLT